MYSVQLGFSVQSTEYSVQGTEGTVYRVHCTGYSVQGTVYREQCTEYSVQISVQSRVRVREKRIMNMTGSGLREEKDG